VEAKAVAIVDDSGGGGVVAVEAVTGKGIVGEAVAVARMMVAVASTLLLWKLLLGGRVVAKA
jgi:hypothetical protein